MKTMKSNPLALLVCGLLTAALNSPAAVFDSGSDGSFGHINLVGSQTTNLTVPPDGVFKCGNITLACGSTLKFNRNGLNTPVFLLATGAVSISGAIVVSGSSASLALAGSPGPGGFSGGMGGISGGRTVGGDGAGPGGGKNLATRMGAAFGFVRNANTNTYGNALLSPLLGGSGGAGTDVANGGGGGGGGGGAILIASNVKIEFVGGCCCGNIGAVNAVGGNGSGAPYAGGGSGGAVRLVAPYIGGSGVVDTTGGSGGACCGYPEFGSQGRIRIDCLDDYAYRALTYAGSFTRGSQMFVFPASSNRLDILQAAGQSIPLGTGSGVTVSLPFGATNSQTVTLRAEGFTNAVPIRIAVTPDTGASLAFDGVMPVGPGPVTNSFNVTIPAGTISRIDAWTK